MASGTITGRTGNADVSAKIEWSYTQNVTANKTTVTATVYIRRLDDGTWTSYGTTNITLSIAGTSKTESKYFSVGHHGTSDWFQMITNTVDVPHNADGTHANITISCTSSGSGTTVEPIACSGTISLPTIARASQPSAGNGTFGGAITINTNRASSSFTHTLTMSMGSHSETKTGVGASLSWTIPASWADTIPTATSNTLSISCTTYSGSTNIGTKTTSCTISIPSSWVPSVSITKTLSNAGDGSKVLVNVTTVNLSASASASTGTSISSYSWSGSVSGTGSSKTHSPTSAGNYSYTVTATDRRGRTATATVSVTAVSGVSTFTCASSVNFGSALAVTITRLKSSFTHSVRYYISSSYTNTLTGQGTSASYTIPTSWAASVPNGSSINMTVTVTTYNGSSSLGSTSKTVSAVVPSSWAPAFTLGVEGVSLFNGQWLKGISKVTVNVTGVSPSTGSSIKSYSVSGPNLSRSSNTSATSYSATSDILGTPGTNTYTVKVTDNRGRVTSKSIGCTVVDYTPPSVKASVGRYTSGGVSDNFGAYGRVSVTGAYTAVNGNKWTLTIKYKKKTASSYTNLNSWSNQTGSISRTSNLFSADVDSAYDCQATITDAVGKMATVTVALSTGKALMDMFKDKVIGIFSTASEALRAIFSNPSSLFYIGADKVAINGDIKIPDKVSTDGMTNGWFSANQLSSALLAATINGERVIPNNTDFNSLIYPGSYFVTAIARAQTMTNMPTQTAGTLYVKRSNGEYTSNGQWQYIIQEFHPFDMRTNFYRRYGDSGDSTTITWNTWRRVDYIQDGVLNNSSLKLSSAAPKLLFTDSASTEATLISYNGSNLWIGTQSSGNYQFRGGTYISSGWNGSAGNPTIYVSVPETTTATNNYAVQHANHRLHLRLFLGNSVLSGNGTVQFTDSTKSADFLLIIGRTNETSTYGTSWSSAIIPTGKYSGSNWTDNSEMTMLMGGGTNFPIKVNRSGDTYTLTRYGSSPARYYVWGFCNP